MAISLGQALNRGAGNDRGTTTEAKIGPQECGIIPSVNTLLASYTALHAYGVGKIGTFEDE